MDMGARRRRGPVFGAALVGTVAAACAAAAPGPGLSLVRGPGQPIAGHAASIVVRARPGVPPRVKVRISRGSARRSFAARAQSRGRYRSQVVFPAAGRWTFGARAPSLRVRLGSVRVRPRAVPLTFVWPTSVDVEPDGSLLLAENGTGRILRIDRRTGKTKAVATVAKAYSVAHAPSGAVYLSAGHSLLRLHGAGGTTPVAQAAGDIGPVAVAANGDVYFATATRVFRVAGGTGAATPVVGQLSGSHGLAVTDDGGLLVSDTGHGRVVRVDLKSGQVETWGDLHTPRGIAVAPDRTVYVVDASTDRIVHLRIDGKRLGSVKRVFHDPYDVAAAGDGSVYVVDTRAAGRLYRVAPKGTTRVVSGSR